MWGLPGGAELGEALQSEMFDLVDDYMFGDQIEIWRDKFQREPVHLGELKSHDDGQDLTKHDFASDHLVTSGFHKQSNANLRCLAYRLRRAGKLYDGELSSVIPADKLAHWRGLLEKASTLFRSSSPEQMSWIECGRQALDTVAKTGGINVLISSAPLILLLAKCFIFEFSTTFKADTVFSASKKSRAHCCKHILKKFGRESEYHIVSDGAGEEDDLASWKEVEELGRKLPAFHVLPVGSVQDLVNLLDKCAKDPPY